jgi:protein-glucosylgalactosylhydroxylysine glucosidase
MAMAAARVGEPHIAIEASLRDAGSKNRYDVRGVNTGRPCSYLPGNGGLLYAVALMAAGWEGGPTRHAPGFPADGTWVVKWEALKRAP